MQQFSTWCSWYTLFQGGLGMKSLIETTVHLISVVYCLSLATAAHVRQRQAGWDPEISMSPQRSHRHGSTMALPLQLHRAFLGQLQRLPERPNRAMCFCECTNPCSPEVSGKCLHPEHFSKLEGCLSGIDSLCWKNLKEKQNQPTHQTKPTNQPNKKTPSHKTRIRSNVILNRGISTLSTLTSTLSPGPNPRLLLFFTLESLASVMFRTGIKPAFPTPISTKTPNGVAFSTFPVKTAPTLKSSKQTMLLLKSGLSKSVIRNKKQK